MSCYRCTAWKLPGPGGSAPDYDNQYHIDAERRECGVEAAGGFLDYGKDVRRGGAHGEAGHYHGR